MLKKYKCVADNSITYYSGDIEEITKKFEEEVEDHASDHRCQTEDFENQAKDFDMTKTGTCGLRIGLSEYDKVWISHVHIGKIDSLVEDGKIVEVKE